MRIKYKLFLTLLLTSLMVSVGMFLFMQWSFDRGFLNYVNRQEVAELDQLSALLESRYAQHGSWLFLQGNSVLWRELLQTAGQGRPADVEGDMQRMPRPGPPPGQVARVALYNADKQRLFAPPLDEQKFQLRPLRAQGAVIGYLSLIPRKELSDAGDLLFMEQQTKSFALVALAMAALSLLLSFPLTNHLLRPVKELTAGTRKLIAGRFKTRIPVATRDEMGQLSTDFNSLAMTLEKNEQARQQWVADISHELRTPLAVLRGEIEALQDGIRQPDTQALDALHGEAMHLGRLIDDLYELSMSDIGALNYKKIRVDPVGILKGSIELFEQRFDQRGLQLTTEIEKEFMPLLLADPDRLQQLFSNLLENSLRYTDAPGQLVVRMEENKETLSISFMDSSPGVPAEHLQRLFERLYRVESSRNRAKGGAGLGMAICRNIVEAHQGRIDATLSPLGGLAITIEFPLRA